MPSRLARDLRERLFPPDVAGARRHVHVVRRRERLREPLLPACAQPVGRALPWLAQVHVLNGTHAPDPEGWQRPDERFPERRQLVDVPVRVDVGDLDALVAYGGDLRHDLPLDLLHRQPVRERAEPNGPGREEAALLVHEPRDLLPDGQRSLVSLADEREMNSDVELRMCLRERDRLGGRGHCGHDRDARQGALLEALDRRSDGVRRCAEVVGVEDDPHPDGRYVFFVPSTRTNRLSDRRVPRGRRSAAEPDPEAYRAFLDRHAKRDLAALRDGARVERHPALALGVVAQEIGAVDRPARKDPAGDGDLRAGGRHPSRDRDRDGGTDGDVDELGRELVRGRARLVAGADLGPDAPGVRPVRRRVELEDGLPLAARTGVPAANDHGVPGIGGRPRERDGLAELHLRGARLERDVAVHLDDDLSGMVALSDLDEVVVPSPAVVDLLERPAGRDRGGRDLQPRDPDRVLGAVPVRVHDAVSPVDGDVLRLRPVCRERDGRAGGERISRRAERDEPENRRRDSKPLHPRTSCCRSFPPRRSPSAMTGAGSSPS